jgi:L-lactate dehydrogenase (cytochrome)
MKPALDRKFPSVFDIEKAALRRMPKFVSEYIAYGMGRGGAVDNNRQTLDQVKLAPRYNVEPFLPDTSCRFLGQTYTAPFGISPVGLGGLAWPHAPELLAESARRASIPFTAATFSLCTIEELKEHAGDMCWFQLYLPNRQEVTEDLLNRAENAGYHNLILTVDIPSVMRRDHDIRNGFSLPLRFSANTLRDLALSPTWSMAMARHSLKNGFPTFETLMPYVPKDLNKNQALEYMGNLTVGHIDHNAIENVRNRWRGNLIIKGLLDPADAVAYRDQGADAIIVSNHGGRQLEAAPSPIEALPGIRKAVGPDFPLVGDSGVRTGLDICRMLACGADFVMAGRPFYYSVAAMGADGADHIVELLHEELQCQMGQLGCANVADIRGRLWAIDKN